MLWLRHNDIMDFLLNSTYLVKEEVISQSPKILKTLECERVNIQITKTHQVWRPNM